MTLPKSFVAIQKNEFAIKTGLKKYIKLYQKATKKRHIPYYAQVVSYSALQYFDSIILNLKVD